MKKMLVLALVLAVAGLANAGLAFKVDGADVANGFSGTGSTVSILLDYTGVDYYTAIVSNAAVVITPDLGVMPDLAGEVVSTVVGNIGNVAEGFDGPVWTIASSTGAAKPLAVFFTVAAGQKPVTIQVLDIDDEFNGSVAGMVTLVPEPMTMALLALGGLFIRRK